MKIFYTADLTSVKTCACPERSKIMVDTDKHHDHATQKIMRQEKTISPTNNGTLPLIISALYLI